MTTSKKKAVRKKATATTTVPKKKAAKKSTAKKTPAKKGSLDLFNGEQYPQIVLSSIEVAKRTKKNIFFNPRQLENFDPVKMAGLLRSIRLDGLLEPVVVAVFTEKGGIKSVLLIAGERRFRSLSKAVEENPPCYDPSIPVPDVYTTNSIVVYTDQFARVSKKQSGDEVEIELLDDNDKPTGHKLKVDASELQPTAPAKKVYTTVACKVYTDPSEERMMRIAVTENQQSEPLTTMEEIVACERLSVLKCKQERISYMLAQNITWVSQTLAFRDQLPPDCFEALMESRMKRNVAVSFLAYDFDKRQKLFENTVLSEEEETARRIKEHREEQEKLEDEAEMLNTDADDAEAAGDEKGARKLRRKSGSKERQATGHSDKADRAESEKGQLKQGHVQKGAAKAGISTRKAKMLPRAEIEKLYVTSLEALTDGETEDPVCGEYIPGDMVALVQLTAQAILKGERDPLSVIRTHQVEQGQWEVDDAGSETAESDEEDDDSDDDSYEPTANDLGDADDAFGELDDEDRDLDEELANMGVEYDD
jgi:ParB-like chromosome segregation protein Spo0J